MCEKTPHNQYPSSVERGTSRVIRLKHSALGGALALAGLMTPGCIANPTPHPEKPETSPIETPGALDGLHINNRGQRFGENAFEAEPPAASTDDQFEKFDPASPPPKVKTPAPQWLQEPRRGGDGTKPNDNDSESIDATVELSDRTV